jgi:hypothetical protein
MNALQLLVADHKKVRNLFAQFNRARTAKQKRDLFARIKIELDTHAALEEEVFYPAMRAAMKGRKVEKAYGEHEVVKGLLRDLATRGEVDDGYEGRMAVLQQSVLTHAREEETGMFVSARRALDSSSLADLGKQMESHRRSLRRGLAGVVTALSEGAASLIEREKQLMDRATTATRRSLQPSSAPADGRRKRPVSRSNRPSARGRAKVTGVRPRSASPAIGKRVRAADK